MWEDPLARGTSPSAGTVTSRPFEFTEPHVSDLFAPPSGAGRPAPPAVVSPSADAAPPAPDAPPAPSDAGPAPAAPPAPPEAGPAHTPPAVAPPVALPPPGPAPVAGLPQTPVPGPYAATGPSTAAGPPGAYPHGPYPPGPYPPGPYPGSGPTVPPHAAFAPPGAARPVPAPAVATTRGPSALTVGVVAAVAGLVLGVVGGSWLGRAVPGPSSAGSTEEPTVDAAGESPTLATTEPGVVVDRTDPDLYPEGGGPANPWPFDAGYTADRWDVVVSTPWDATSAVLAHDPDNESPPEGFQYWVVPLAATYTGALPTANASQLIDVVFVDGSGVVHSEPCGAVPFDLADAEDVARGETAEGRLCVTVPAGADGLWRLSSGGSLPLFLSTEA